MRKIRVVVDNRLRIDVAEARSLIGDDGLRRLRVEHEHRNVRHFEIASMGYVPPASEPPTIATWSYVDDGRTLTLPRGGTDRVRAVAEVAGVGIAWDDRRARGDPAMGAAIPDHRLPEGWELYDHQKLAIDAIVRRENVLIRSPTASGKSTIVIAAAARLKVATLVIVWTTGLLEQWVEECMLELGLDEKDVGVIQGHRRRLRPVTIAMLQTLDSRGVDEELQRTFGAVFADECQRIPAVGTLRVLDSFPARYRVGLSDNHLRADGKECVTVDMLGKVAVDIPVDELEAKGLVMPVQVRVVPTDFEAPWWTGSASFDLVLDGKSGEPGEDRNRLLAEMIDDPGRDALLRRIVRTEVGAGSQVLVFTWQVPAAIDLADRLRDDGHSVGILIGRKNSTRRQFRASVRGILAREIQVGVGTIQAIGTGQNLPHVSAGILAQPISQKKPYLFRQIRGRLSRAPRGKTRAVLYVPVDVRVLGTSMLSTLLRWNDDNVVVLHDGRWVTVPEYLRARRSRRR